MWLGSLVDNVSRVPAHQGAHMSNKCPIPLPSFVQPDLCRRNKPSWDMVYHQGYNLEAETQQLAWIRRHGGCDPRKSEVCDRRSWPAGGFV